MNKPTKIITHTAVSSTNHTAQDVDVWHKQRWPGYTSSVHRNKAGELYHVGYHYIIEWNGIVVQTRAEWETAAHCIGQNSSSIGICFMGNGDVHEPSEAQITSWKHLFADIKSRHTNITPSDIYPHRRYANKSCHGSKMNDTYFSEFLEPANITAMKATIRRLEQEVTRLVALLSGRRMK